MAYLFLLSLAVFICEVYPQACGPVLLPPLPPCPPPCAPLPCATPCSPSVQVFNPNPQVTTIIDNSVSNALVNALQLLIVSNLIGSTVGPAVVPQPLLSNLGPLLETLACPVPCDPIGIVIPECPYPNIEIIPPCGPVATCPCPNFEFISPCGPIIDAYPPPFCGLTDIISPNFYTYTETITPFIGCIDTIPPNIYNGCKEICPVYGIDAIGPNFCGGFTEINPNFYPLEFNPYYGGFAETISPTVAALAPNMFGGLTEVLSPNLPPFSVFGPDIMGPFGPVATLAPNCYGGLTEVVSQVPLAAEVVFPSAIPAQLTCNFGYTPSSQPCVRVNVEPLPFDPCGCNGYGPFYY